MADYIALDDCVVGAVYRLRSRNLLVGVWNGKGFVGIREKFGDEYLFTEYHYDSGPPFGTVRPDEDLGMTLESMSLTEFWGLVCANCGKPGWKDRENWVYPTGNHCAGGCDKVDLRMRMNQMLFDALLAIETPIRQQIEAERPKIVPPWRDSAGE